MPHLRRRHVAPVFDSLKKFSPLIGIFGHRQVGKTTFLEQVCGSYYTFDDRQTLIAAQSDAKSFLKQLGKRPAGIDESQLCEELFPALKEQVRQNKEPGQIVLSGSVRFYSRKAIRESLTGRIVNVDMLPLVLTELAEIERARLPLRLLQKESYTEDWNSSLSEKTRKSRTRLIELYLRQGGLPGVCFLRNDRLRSEQIRSQLQLMLDRDIRLVYPSSLSYTQILDFVTQLANQEGGPIHPSILRKQTGISEVTQKKLIQALEAIFAVRLLAIEGDRKGLCAYFEDQAEQAFLLPEKSDPLRQFEGLVYRNIRATFFYEVGCDFKFFQYRARPDVRVPFAVRTKEGCLGIFPILENEPTRTQIRMAHRFLQRYSPATALFVTVGITETCVIEPRILQIPAERLLFEE